jgi:phenylpropionate dioxygenase-like ring-hydroxylating dioxygenase large terminal subunit
VPVRLGLHEGFICLNLDPETEPLELLRDLPDWSRFQYRTALRQAVYEVAANWKMICETTAKCYHCPGVHRSSSASATTSRAVIAAGDRQLLQRRTDGAASVETMSMSGKRTVPIIPGCRR